MRSDGGVMGGVMEKLFQCRCSDDGRSDGKIISVSLQ